MIDKVPTVKIKSPENKRLGFRVINASDFDASKHEMFEPAKVVSKPDVEKTEAVKAAEAKASVDVAKMAPPPPPPVQK